MQTTYRKKKFKSDLMNNLHERYIRFRKVFKAFMKRFKEKGNERLTLMLIPHSEKKIFNFQISNFTISFFVIVLAVVVAFSILSLNDHEASQTQITKLSNLSKSREGQIMAFKNRAEVTFENFGRFESQMKKLAENVGVESVGAVFPFYGKGGEDLAISPELREKYGKNFTFPEEIEKLDSLNRNVMRNTEQLRRVNSFVDNLRQVMRFTPSLWPVNGGGFVTSHFGPRRSPFTGMPSFHSGIDIAWWPGSQIKATAAGEVKFVGYEGAYGLTVRIKHKYGFSTRYAHLQSANVSTGQNVEKGQVLGGMGNTGRATGYHLHYEVILGNTVIDPQPYLTSRY